MFSLQSSEDETQLKYLRMLCFAYLSLFKLYETHQAQSQALCSSYMLVLANYLIRKEA